MHKPSPSVIVSGLSIDLFIDSLFILYNNLQYYRLIYPPPFFCAIVIIYTSYILLTPYYSCILIFKKLSKLKKNLFGCAMS